jgi:hypothetical protein
MFSWHDEEKNKPENYKVLGLACNLTWKYELPEPTWQVLYNIKHLPYP